jgi:hypothetical protein
MNKEIKIVVGVGLAAGTVVGAYYINELNRQKSGFPANAGYERRQNNMSFLKHDYDDLIERMETVTDNTCNMSDYACVSTIAVNKTACGKPSLSAIEKEKIVNMVKGMSEEEMRVALENIPIDMMFTYIGSVLEKNRKFAQTIQDAVLKLQE